MNSAKKPSDYNKSIDFFESLKEYKDSDEMRQKCVYLQLQLKKQKRNKIFIFFVVTFVISSLCIFAYANIKYNIALEAYRAQDYTTAFHAFLKIKDFKDSNNYMKLIIDSYHKKTTNSISASLTYTIGLKSDGTVVVTNYYLYDFHNVQSWNHIVSVFASPSHTVGLKSNGTVVATGVNDNGQCDVQDWNDIISISTGPSHTVGLKSNGTVVATGFNLNGQCDVQDWNDIISISVGPTHTVGLKSDGTVVATGANNYRKCEVQYWNEIKTDDNK